VVLLILWYIVRHIKLLIIPLVTVAVAFIMAALMTLPWMDLVAIPHDVPAAMGSVILALCMDYSLFILSRFSEQHNEGWPLQPNVDKIKKYTNRTISVSGLLVAIAFFGSLLLPERNMQGTGLCLGFATLACVGTSVILAPSFLLVAGTTLAGSSNAPVKVEGAELHGYTEDVDEDLPDPTTRRHTSCWASVMRVVAVSPCGALMTVVFLLSPLFWHLTELNISGDRFALLPMTMPAVTALRRVQQSFPVGVLDPYAILITSPPQPSILQVNQEISGVFAGLKEDDFASMVKAGLSSTEVAGLASFVQDFKDMAHVSPSIFAAAKSGSAMATAKAHGLSDEDALKSALRVAKDSALNLSQVEVVVATAVAVLREHPTESEAVVMQEALRLGWNQEDSAQISGAVRSTESNTAGTHSLHANETLAVARSSAAAVSAWHRGKTVEDIFQELSTAPIPKHDLVAILSIALATEKLVKLPRAHDGSDTNTSGVDFPFLQDGTFGGKLESNISKGSSQVGKRVSDFLSLADAFESMSSRDRGMVLMPSGFNAMLDLCDTLQGVGGVSSMLGPSWALHTKVDWVTAVGLNLNPKLKNLYRALLQTHVTGRRALLEVHTTFPSTGAGGADWVVAARKVLVEWESCHPGYTAELAGGASEAADTRHYILDSMWTYLGASVSLITVVVYCSFQSLLVPVRLALALVLTLAATFGAGALIYQTPLLHSLFPSLVNFDGVSYEVVPLVTGVAIALGLDYDIFLVSRIAEFRLQRYSDRASIFRGVLATGEVITGAGLTMALAFSGLCFSDKMMFQQFGVLLIISVLFDSFIVRTVLVPAMMLVAQSWNWWPRIMPPAIHDVFEGEVESSGGLSRPMMEGTRLGAVMQTRRKTAVDDWDSGFVA